ncbi:MAG: hypothetical protein E7321_03880 [Clostridiales bacterium]|nr:hypothetical protein [Clostridiales bacterium]
MTVARFEELLSRVGNIAPQGLERYVKDLEAEASELLPAEVLQSVLDANGVPQEKQAPLFDALHQINAIPELVELAHIMAKDAVRALNRCTAIEFFQPKPDCLTGFAREAFAFLYTQLCVLEGRKALRLRGVPEQYDADIPERMTRKQLGKYVKTGDISFDDYPWDMNFYCCAIFLFDRFYFIPYRWGDTPAAWRNSGTGEVIAMWKGGERVRRDGQLDGVNGVHDVQAFATVYEEDAQNVYANPVLPEGVIAREPVRLAKGEWTQILDEGDYLLALHIPGGEGYTPERVKSSCELALAFYAQYYPELPIKGFWSESWLYDPGLKALLPADSRIIRVQRQFYCYPTPEGEEMIGLEVFGDRHVNPDTAKPETSLQRALIAAWKEGKHFHTTGMFLLSKDVPNVGHDPYWKEE